MYRTGGAPRSAAHCPHAVRALIGSDVLGRSRWLVAVLSWHLARWGQVSEALTGALEGRLTIRIRGGKAGRRLPRGTQGPARVDDTELGVLTRPCRQCSG